MPGSTFFYLLIAAFSALQKPELRCDDPEQILTLGKLEPGEPVIFDRSVCYRVRIVQGMDSFCMMLCIV